MIVAPTRSVSSTGQCNRGGVLIKSLAEEECVVGALTRPAIGTGQCNWGGVLINAFVASPKELLNEIGVLRDSLCNNMSEFDSDTSSVVSIEFEKWI